MPSPILYNKKFNELTEEEKELLTINKKSISDFVEQSSIISDVDYATRNAHATTYAVLKGEFKVNTNLPDNLQPFFDKEKYDLIIRFSNAHLKITKSKKEMPAYGFSVKIKDETGDVLANYPLVNFPLFPVNSVSTFLKLFTSLNQFFIKKWNHVFPLAYQIIKITPSVFTFSFLKHLFRLISRRNNFFLSFDFHSIGVYRLGEYMIKIQLKPQSPEKNFGKKTGTREAIENYFSSNEYVADVLVQLCCDLKDQPINILNREWKNAPLIKIGEVLIKKDGILERSCEHELLSFNPFESKTIFQPVGKIQKLRDEAYKVSVQTRRKINKLLHG
ncbi:catalase [Chryseobacterium sp. B21-037]|uniref:catalase n=1 Tax=Chryseobacterium sp. B21-037 TaxID=2926038 RepID=UPI002359C99C|nr:catalase [Chryseobacterium sp. B21-037]MDC8106762.1 catalase [Chryseobacterium sp. B21-037]